LYRSVTAAIPAANCSLTLFNRTRREGLKDRLSQKLQPPLATAPSTLGQVNPASMLTRWIRPPKARFKEAPNVLNGKFSLCHANFTASGDSECEECWLVAIETVAIFSKAVKIIVGRGKEKGVFRVSYKRSSQSSSFSPEWPIGLTDNRMTVRKFTKQKERAKRGK